MARPSAFEKALAARVKWWPGLYSCRARILDHLFATIGNGEEWKDGRLTDGLRSEKDRQRLFDRVNADRRRLRESLERHAAEQNKDHKPQRFRPESPRTPEQVAKVLNDRRHPDVLRTNRDRSLSEFLGGFKAYRQRQGNTLFYPMCENYSRCFTVPDDVRPDWLAGIREFLGMVIKWDDNRNVEIAKKALANLEARFGPAAEWHKRKRVRTVPNNPVKEGKPK